MVPFYRCTGLLDSAFPFKLEVKDNLVLQNSTLHSHEYFQICYMLRGTCLHTVNGKHAALIKGDLFSIPPNYEHHIQLLPGKEAAIVHIDFMPYLLNHALQGLTDIESFVNFAFIEPFVALNDRLLPKLNLTFSGQQGVEALIDEMMKELEQQREGYTLIIKSNLQKLLVFAGREYEAFLERHEENNRLQENKKYFMNALDYINKHYREEIKLQEAAAQATMSPSYFSTMFKVIQGKSFVEYVNELRLKEAMKLLLQSQNSIEDILIQIGYNHRTHFYRHFKKATGLTPAEFRKRSL